MKKYIQKMWRIYDVLFFDKEKPVSLEDKIEVAKKCMSESRMIASHWTKTGFLPTTSEAWFSAMKKKL